MKKTDTIALYKEEFLAGKDEETRRRFEEKDVEKQYGSIIAWRRRNRVRTTQEETDGMTPATILDTLRKIRKAVPELPALSQADAEKISGVIGEIADDIRNFDRIKKSQLLSRLENEQQEIDRQRNSLQERINSLRNELNWQ